MLQTTAAIVGTGLAGLATAAALAAHGIDCVLIGPRPPLHDLGRDTRSTALFGGSIALLRHLGVFQRLGRAATAMTGLRLIDATGGLVRAPEVLFQAHELDLAAFGYNIENATLLRELWATVDAARGVRHLDTTVTAIDLTGDSATLTVETGTPVQARLLVGADGAHSLSRASAGIAAALKRYPQAAIATRFAHTRAHDGISNEFHRRAGPLTTVPLPDRYSSLVWVEPPGEADRLLALAPDAFLAELSGHLAGLLGTLSNLGPRARFDLSSFTADTIARNRVALVGEAAHRLPPIGAQGLNLGLRDAAWLAEIAGDALARGDDPGGPQVLDAYQRARHNDVSSRVRVVDGLNRSLIADLLPFDVARSAGLAALKSFPGLRRHVMQQGIAPSGASPRLLQALPD